jgi:hypothetical protein
MHNKGYAVIKDLLTVDQCQSLKQIYENPGLFRKTVIMERHLYGRGEYKYFSYPLPDLVQTIRERLYPYLVPVANRWMQVLRTGFPFPESFFDFQARCIDRQQTLPTPLILKYKQGGYNTLHQDLYGEVYFPIQSVLFLSEPDRDYTGGEFVLTEQIQRRQSKATVIRPSKGDMLLFATSFRPVRGLKRYYRATMRHGVSEVLHGERYTLGMIFHDASS